MNCASCGANLEIKTDTNSFTCGYCGASQLVERHGGTVSLKLVTDSIARVQVGTDKTAAELAIVRLKNEIADADSAYKRAAHLKNSEKDQWTKYCVVAFVLSLGIAPILFAKISVVLIFLTWVVSLGGIGFIWYKRRQMIYSKYAQRIEDAHHRCKLLRQRLSAQMEIVNR